MLEIGHVGIHLLSHNYSLTLPLCTCSFLASFQQMSMDEKAAQIIARVVEGKLLLWPQTLGSSPQPMADQSYILSHAGFVKVSTSVEQSRQIACFGSSQSMGREFLQLAGRSGHRLRSRAPAPGHQQ